MRHFTCLVKLKTPQEKASSRFALLARLNDGITCLETLQTTDWKDKLQEAELQKQEIRDVILDLAAALYGIELNFTGEWSKSNEEVNNFLQREALG